MPSVLGSLKNIRTGKLAEKILIRMRDGLSFALRLVGLLCLGAGLLVPALALPAAKFKGVTVPIYTDGQPQAVAVLKVKRIFRENRKLGFFRVKLMPTMVGEEVRLEFRQATVDAAVLAQVYALVLRLAEGSGFELRSVSFSFAGESAPRLEARQVHSQSAAARRNSTHHHPALVLEDATLRLGGREWHWPRALLHMAGPEAARLEVESRRAGATFDLFQPTLDPNPPARQANAQ